MIKKIKMITIVIMVSSLFLCSCTRQQSNKKKLSKKANAYEIFTQDYDNISKKFSMKNFKEIGEGELQNSCVAFAKLQNFSEKNDMIDKNIMKPVKKKLYYYNHDDNILIYITHIYMKESMDTHLLTSDYPYEEIKSEYKLKMPVYSETYMCYRHTLVNLKVYSFDNNTSKLTKTGIKALKEYDSILKK